MSENQVSIGSEIIEASAGSGKTYALTNRFIKLMAYGVAADRIVALTFTVKAAGEFFDAILEKLAKAASDAQAAKRLAQEVEREDFGQADFLRLLKELTRGMHRLTLGTLDSFFVRVVSAFPLEFGLGGEFSMMVEKSKIESIRASVAERVFYEVVENKQALHDFLEAFKQATFGIEENSFFKNLDGFIEDYQRLYLDVPAGDRWGDAQAIWPTGEWAVQGDGRAELDRALKRLLSLSPELGSEDKQQRRWRAFFEDSKKVVAGMALPKGVEYLTDNFIKQWDELREGSAKITIERKKIEFDAAACQAVVDFVKALVAMNFAAKLKSTHGVWKVIDAYERCYDEKVRRRGQLQFEDVARVMGGQHGLSEGAENGVSFELAYRLDAQFDHWLLDEFQDTSRVQWRAIKDLVDEVVQDSEGRRSYFQVGDTKQSIYGWRGGDPKLFAEVVEQYRAGLEVKSLDESYRSGPAIIDTVNQVFSARDTLQGLLSQEAVNAFHWKEHTCSHKTKGLAGFAALWHPDVDKAKAEDVLDLMVQTVMEVDPLARGLSCAILCRGGKMVDKVIDRLREAGIDEVEGGANVSIVSDNPVTLALLSLIQLAGHPGDRFAAGHLRMTPIAAWMKREDVPLRRLSMESLAMIDGQGFEALLVLWKERLEASGDLQDEFAQQRLLAFLQMAREFDETGDRSVDGFLEYAEGQKAKAQVSKKAIQVMTIHASKGLGFDVVILPEIDGRKSLATVDNGLSLGGSEQQPWVLDLPNKAFQELDPVLRKHREDLQAAAEFESLCVLYVAMTRAKQGLYMLSTPYGSSKALNFLALLEATLSESDDEGGRRATKVGDGEVVVSYDRGEREWYLEHERIESGAQDLQDASAQDGKIELGMGQTRERRLTPSDHGVSQYGAELLFSARGSDARVFGNQVHALFEQIEWLQQGEDLPLFLTDGEGQQMDAQLEARDHVRRALEESDIVELLLKPDPTAGLAAELWREKAFELLLSDGWVSGVFDRVVLFRDSGSGALVRAEIIDYKTSRVEGQQAIAAEAEVYRPQMTLYREALMKLTSLTEKNIRCVLVFTQPRVKFEI